MINKITFLLQRKKNASSHLFSKQLKNLQSNHLIGGFIPIIYSSQAVKTLLAAPFYGRSLAGNRSSRHKCKKQTVW